MKTSLLCFDLIVLSFLVVVSQQNPSLPSVFQKVDLNTPISEITWDKETSVILARGAKETFKISPDLEVLDRQDSPTFDEGDEEIKRKYDCRRILHTFEHSGY